MELPDWLRGIAFIGTDGAMYRVVKTDPDGNLVCLVSGKDGTDVLRTVRTDEFGQLITVLRGADGNYVSVDASGFLSAVLYGNYLGTLKQVAVDTDGRLSAFVIDSVDAWNRMLTIGNAELAVRLGSIVRYDRRGSVRDVIDFSEGITGVTSVTLSGSGTYALDPITSQAGYSMKCLVNNPPGTNSVDVLVRRAARPLSKRGIEIAFCINTIHPNIELHMRAHNGSGLYQSGIWFDVDAGVLQYMDSVGNWVQFASGVVAPCVVGVWCNLKYVFDFRTRTYSRCIFSGTEYDMSSLHGQSGYSADAPDEYSNIAFIGYVGGSNYCYLDSVILTDAEP
jgi:hypothetical protein